MFEDTKHFRPTPNYPLYPGNYVKPEEYLEQYFYDFYVKNSKGNIDRTYIPIWWTNLFLNNGNNYFLPFVQEYLNSLNPRSSYFTIVQMDDGVTYALPEDTLVFHAGGNTGDGKKIPIPLVSSSIPSVYIKENVEKKYLASFVGSTTHPIRELGKMWLQQEPGFHFVNRQWKNHVVENEFEEFCQLAQESWFNLCFAGYGDSSFRLYQSFELGTIPVYISDRPFWLPEYPIMKFFGFKWEDFSVLVKTDQILEIPSILNSISVDKRREMIKLGEQVYSKFFKLESTCLGIFNHLWSLNHATSK